MAACENDELCCVGLELGIALLEGGNAVVQARVPPPLTPPRVTSPRVHAKALHTVTDVTCRYGATREARSELIGGKPGRATVAPGSRGLHTRRGHARV